MTNSILQYERIDLAVEKSDILTDLPLNISGAITGDSIMKVISRTRDKNGKYVRESHIKVTKCERCGKEVRQTSRRKRFCSQDCYRANKRYIDLQGYVCIKMPKHPHATTNGWVREHIVVACQAAGRNLKENECVHHIDGNRLNNEPDNLMILPLAVHVQIHNNNPFTRRYGEQNPKIRCACGCGKEIYKYDNRGRPRKYILGHHRGKKDG